MKKIPTIICLALTALIWALDLIPKFYEVIKEHHFELHEKILLPFLLGWIIWIIWEVCKKEPESCGYTYRS